MIKPTIGRKVWFYEHGGAKEQDATIIDVHGDRCVNLFVIGHTGNVSTPRSVPLVQEGDPPANHMHCAWMPYQQGQAKAHGQANVAAAPPPAPVTE